MRRRLAAPVVVALALAAGCGGANWSSGAPTPTTQSPNPLTGSGPKPTVSKVPVPTTRRAPAKSPAAVRTTTTPTTPTVPVTSGPSTPTSAPGDSSVGISGIDPAITSVGVANLEWVEYDDPSGVALSHPRSWTIHVAAVGPIVISIDGDRADPAGFRRTVNVLEQPLADGLTAADYLNYTLAQITESGGVVESSTPVTLDGVSGRATTWHTTHGAAQRFLSVWAVRGQLAFLVTYSSDTKNFAIPLVDVKRLIASIRLPPPS